MFSKFFLRIFLDLYNITQNFSKLLLEFFLKLFCNFLFWFVFPDTDYTNLTNPSDHTTNCQTGFFFLRHFTPGRQWPYHGLTDWGFFLPGPWDRGMVTDVQGQKCDWKKNEKTRFVRLWYGHWRAGSKTWLKKYDPVCQTVIWLLAG